MAIAFRSASKRQYIRYCQGCIEIAIPLKTALMIVGAMLVSSQSTPAHAQALTADPGAWRPLSYSDLRRPEPRSATYVDLWKDAIDNNNQAYAERGDRRFIDANAPATEAHFVIWSNRRSVVISVLDTALGCTLKTRDPVAHVVVKRCPMRIAIYEGLQVHTMDAGAACFIEPEPGTPLDGQASAAYGAYDVLSRTVRLGVIINHQALEGCSFNIPLPRP